MAAVRGIARVFLFTTLLAGCAAGDFEVDVVSPPGTRTTLQAIAVYPFTFRYEHESYESYEKTQDIIAQLVASGKTLVLGSDEFRIFPQQLKSDHPFATTTLISSLNKMGLDRSRVAVLRGWAEERVQATQAATYDKRGKGRGHAVARATTLVVHLEVLYPEGREVLFELTGTRDTDPFDEPIEWDPRPELRQLLGEMVDALVLRLGDYFDFARRPTDFGFQFLTNHRRLFDYALAPKPPYRKIVDRLDMLEREVEVHNRYRYFYPDLEYTAFEQFEQLPEGLLVRAVSNPALTRSGLAPGDVVVRWHGGVVAGPQQLQRLQEVSPADGRSEIVVSRSGKLVTLPL